MPERRRSKTGSQGVDPARPGREAATWHREQETDSSCVAACVRMVKASQGVKVSEESIREDLGRLYLASLPTAARTFGWTRQFLHFDRAEEREVLLGHLARGARPIVDVYPGYLTMLAERRGLISRHGPLMLRSPEDRERSEDLGVRVPQLPHHAIVLVGLGDGIIHYLDPWFPGVGQPFSVSFEDFFRMWTGQIVIPFSEPSRGT